MSGEISHIAWRKSRRCASNACLETANDGEDTLVRDSKNVGGAVLRYSNDVEWPQIMDAAAAAGKRVHEATEVDAADQNKPDLREFGVNFSKRSVVVHHLGESAYQLATKDGPVQIEYALIDSTRPDAVQEYSQAEVDAWLEDAAYDDTFRPVPSPA